MRRHAGTQKRLAWREHVQNSTYVNPTTESRTPKHPGIDCIASGRTSLHFIHLTPMLSQWRKTGSTSEDSAKIKTSFVQDTQRRGYTWDVVEQGHSKPCAKKLRMLLQQARQARCDPSVDICKSKLPQAARLGQQHRSPPQGTQTFQVKRGQSSAAHFLHWGCY